ncbi:MAG: HIT family protein [Firmicutes bacterium]|nr:HIT family protein [Alicyclobacillaceae bacterium]MCL6497254.1 HIT family protein [Bacillota bacterium]
MPTVFSRIIARELPSYGVREDDRFYAFLDIYPVRPGHTLVVPKVEVDYFFDLPPDILREIWVFSQPVAAALRRVTGCLRVGAVVAGLEVPHAHLHLIPIDRESDLHLDRRAPASPDALAEMAAAIRAALES